MPQASDDLRQRMRDRFGSIMDDGPSKFLTGAGYVLTRGWEWKPKPGVSRHDDMTEEEWECLLFLVDEWDYGALEAA